MSRKEKYIWIKLKDICGETYEFEDCEVKDGPFAITVYFVAPLGTVEKVFLKRNLVSFEYINNYSRAGKE